MQEHLGEEVEAENRKEQEALLMAEVEEAEKKESTKQKKLRSAEVRGEICWTVAGKCGKEVKYQSVENKRKPEITKPEITQIGDHSGGL